jgi:UDP-GlcNAc3NAcA epimerase
VKILTVVGARPQFIKAAAVCAPLRRVAQEVLVHTGQHYDASMSDRFFTELSLPTPEHHLGIGAGTHGAQTGKMLEGLESVMLRERPDRVLVYGDTNSTLAGALAAAKLGVPITHVEAGLRSFNRVMPEEINRVVADHLSTVLCCPGPSAARNLEAEGIMQGVHITGDVMRDLFVQVLPTLDDQILSTLGLTRGGYSLLTLHRVQNTDDAASLSRIIATLSSASEPIVFPAHPRTVNALAALGAVATGALRTIAPVGYHEMLSLQRGARLIFTDSGGVQKEAYWLGVGCVTLRDETEWIETVEAGWNRLVGSDPDAVRAAMDDWPPPPVRPELYGDGRAAERIVNLLIAG